MEAKPWLVQFFCFTVLLFSTTSGWQYGNEDGWDDMCQTGKQQSPINLRKHEAELKTFTPFEFHNYDHPYKAVIVNNGHTVQLKLQVKTDPPSVRGGGLPGKYILDHLHFHWESEHTLHGNRYPLEVHLVHYNSKFNSTAKALSSQQGLAVLGVLFDISQKEHEELQEIIKEITDEENDIGKEEEHPGHVAVEDFLPNDRTGFYRYEGSLTTPNCNEAVIWTVFTQMQKMSHQQLKVFQSLEVASGHVLSENYRNLQPLHGRTITLKLSDLQSSGSTTDITKILPIMAILCAIFLH